MNIVHGSRIPYTRTPLSHRGKGPEFKTFFLGTENTPENYWFNIARQKDFYSPLHKHNFDQFRLAWSGSISIRPDLTLEPGQMGYFPEGVYYGPQEDGPGIREVLVLQFGGTSGQGFLSEMQLLEANQELSKDGKFEKGKYQKGESIRDGYEALWEYCNKGKKLAYPKGRYHTPLLLDPAAFSWKRFTGDNATGRVFKKNLGVFSERETVAEIWKLEDGAELNIAHQNAIQLFFVLSGDGKADSERWEKESAMRLQPGKSVTLTTSSEIEILRFVLPMLPEDIN